MEVLVATALLGVAALGVMHLTKQQLKSKIAGEVDNDIIQASALITSSLTHPAHCNANFSGLVTGTNISVLGIYNCPTGATNNCRATPYEAYGSGAATGARAVSIPATTAGWNQTTTKISNRTRISSITYSISSMTGVTLGTLNLSVTFQKKDIDGTVKTLPTKKYAATVVVTGSAIAGCPVTWNSTIVY